MRSQVERRSPCGAQKQERLRHAQRHTRFGAGSYCAAAPVVEERTILGPRRRVLRSIRARWGWGLGNPGDAVVFVLDFVTFPAMKTEGLNRGDASTRLRWAAGGRSVWPSPRHAWLWR